jgi:CRP-like cAMP-binding protein
MGFTISKFHFNSVDLFDGLPEEQLQFLRSNTKRIETKKGELIFKRGASSKGIYFVVKGKVKVYQVNQDGKSQIVYIYRKGEFFGYRPLLCNGTHPVTAEAMEDSVISFIPKTKFLQVLNISPELANKLLFNLSHEFAVWINTTAAFAQQTVKERFALTLLILNETFKKEGITKPIELNLSREDLASYVGTAVETLVRILKELKEKKILEVKGRKIKIMKPEALISMIEIY